MPKELTAIKVQQWLKEWDAALTYVKPGQTPPRHFYAFSMSAAMLRRMAETYRRGGDQGTPAAHRGEDPMAIQRRHDPKRSAEIQAYVKSGYPWSTLSKTKQNSPEYDNLVKPGWLPSAIIINILTSKDMRRGNRKISQRDIVKVEDKADGTAKVVLPDGSDSHTWKPQDLPPFEVIDGQHRLWAFDDVGGAEKFELPVVAFVGLSREWQAYLFWIINIKPKKISSSLAFDLYPLLRAVNWMDRGGDLEVYRETRAQELVEALWAMPQSPWHNRINMLGETGLGKRMVTQAAWIRALTATVLRAPSSRGTRRPALFTANLRDEPELVPPVPWTRAQEAAFIIYAAQHLRDAVDGYKKDWAKEIRHGTDPKDGDAAFYGPSTLLNNDQGTNAFLMLLNDLVYEAALDLEISSWQMDEEDPSAADMAAVKECLKSLAGTKLGDFLRELAEDLASFDWRSSSAESLTEAEKEERAVFRGSSGYGHLYRQVLEHLATQKGPAKAYAKKLL